MASLVELLGAFRKDFKCLALGLGHRNHYVGDRCPGSGKSA